MAWNDIQWADVRSGWQENQRADRAESESNARFAIQSGAQMRQEGERRREFDTTTEERKREFDARLPLIQWQLKTQQDAAYDQQMFPILMQKLVNDEATPEEAATHLKTVPARENLLSMSNQINSKKAIAEFGRLMQGGADLSTPEGEALAWGVLAAHPEFGERGFRALEMAINHANMSKDRQLAAVAKAEAARTEGLPPKATAVFDPLDPTKRIGTVITPEKGSAVYRDYTSEEEMSVEEKATLKALATRRNQIHKLILEEKVSLVPHPKVAATLSSELATVEAQIDALHHKPGTRSAPTAANTGVTHGPPAPAAAPASTEPPVIGSDPLNLFK